MTDTGTGEDRTEFAVGELYTSMEINTWDAPAGTVLMDGYPGLTTGEDRMYTVRIGKRWYSCETERPNRVAPFYCSQVVAFLP